MSTSYEYFAPSFDFPAGKQIIGIHVYGFSPRVLKKKPRRDDSFRAFRSPLQMSWIPQNDFRVTRQPIYLFADGFVRPAH